MGGVGQAALAEAEAGAPEAGHRLDVFAALGVPHAATFAAVDQDSAVTRVAVEVGLLMDQAGDVAGVERVRRHDRLQAVAVMLGHSPAKAQPHELSIPLPPQTLSSEMSERLEHSMVRIAATAASLVVALPLLSSCAALESNNQGPLQPQAVSGPCDVKKFFFLGLRAVPVEMTVANTGQACTFVLINPALNAVVNAALLTVPAQHGQAQSGVTSGARQAVVSYVPAPGYVGHDTFTVTLEPNAVGMTVGVTVTR